MPYLAQDPSAVGSTVFGYSSIYGEWGYTQLATLFFPDPPSYLHGAFDVQGSHLIFAQILKIVLMGAIIFTSFRFRKNLSPVNHYRPIAIPRAGVWNAVSSLAGSLCSGVRASRDALLRDERALHLYLLLLQLYLLLLHRTFP